MDAHFAEQMPFFLVSHQNAFDWLKTPLVPPPRMTTLFLLETSTPGSRPLLELEDISPSNTTMVMCAETQLALGNCQH